MANVNTNDDIKFHNVIPSREMIEEASESADPDSPQLAMAREVLEFVSTPKGRAQFGDPESGSTLEQIWRLRLSSTGARLVCLVASGRGNLNTSTIPTVVTLNSTELVETMAQLLETHPNSSVHSFVFNGERGYAMTLLDYDPDTRSFTVNEPNPERSQIGTVEAPGGAWHLAAADLAHVVCAVFLPPPVWADLNGVSYEITYANLQESELWSFFGVRETHRQDIAHAQTIVFLEPGGFKEENKLQLRLDRSERVRGAVLLQARPWLMSSSGANPFALDLAKGFVKVLTPEPDDTSELVAGLWALKSMDELSNLGITPSSEIGIFLQAYIGATPEAWLLKDFVKIQAKTITHEGIKFMQLQMDHW